MLFQNPLHFLSSINFILTSGVKSRIANYLWLEYRIKYGKTSKTRFPNVLYHITSRGDRREDIYEDDEDRIIFLTLLGMSLLFIIGFITALLNG